MHLSCDLLCGNFVCLGIASSQGFVPQTRRVKSIEINWFDQGILQRSTFSVLWHLSRVAIKTVTNFHWNSLITFFCGTCCRFYPVSRVIHPVTVYPRNYIHGLQLFVSDQGLVMVDFTHIPFLLDWRREILRKTPVIWILPILVLNIGTLSMLVLIILANIVPPYLNKKIRYCLMYRWNCSALHEWTRI